MAGVVVSLPLLVAEDDCPVLSVWCPDGSVVHLSAPARVGTDCNRNESSGEVVAAAVAAAAGTGFITNMILGQDNLAYPPPRCT